MGGSRNQAPMYRFDLTDAQRVKIAPFLPDRYPHGPAWRQGQRPPVNGILWHPHAGAS